MAADVQVFVDIELAMTRVLNRALVPAVRAQVADATDTMRGAERAIDQINLGPAAESVRSELELLGLNAVLLGAAQFTEGREVKLTRLVQSRVIPPEVALATHQIITALDGSGTELVRQAAQAELVEAEAEDPTIPITGVSDTALFPAGFGRVRKQFAGLAGRLNSAVASGTQLQASVNANIMTSRLVQFGALSQAEAGGIQTWQWNAQLDSKTCPFCTGMHGKTFTVGQSLSRVLTILRSQDPNVARAISPWPAQTRANLNRLAGLSNAKLQEEGVAQPPGHPHCRCVASVIGTVPSSQIVGFLRFTQQQAMARQLAAHKPSVRNRPPPGVDPEDVAEGLTAPPPGTPSAILEALEDEEI